MKSPWLDTYEAAKYLGFKDRATGVPNARAALEFINKYVPKSQIGKRGRAVVVHSEDLDAAVKTREEVNA